MNTIRFVNDSNYGAQKNRNIPQLQSWAENGVDVGFSRCKSEEIKSHAMRDLALASNYTGSVRTKMLTRTMSLGTTQIAAHTDFCLHASGSDQNSVAKMKQTWRNKHIAHQQMLATSHNPSWLKRILMIPKCTLRKQK
jgi:hypothetical protein